MTTPTTIVTNEGAAEREPAAEAPEATQVELTSVLTCPSCGGETRETMPTDACQFFYECPHCGATLRPKAGDCCVYCSYGSVACPPVQQEAADCCA